MVKYVFILEDEKKFQKEISNAILAINPQVRIRLFESLHAFSAWIKTLIEKGASVVHQAGTSIEGQPEPEQSKEPGQILLLVSKEEFLGSHEMPLLRKTHELFLRKGLCEKSDPTSIVLTSFDHSNFDMSLIEGRLVNNVIMKPFESLILQQHLCFAMSGHHPPSAYTIQNMKMDAVVEMLKEVHVEAFSEVGFLTRSQMKIEVGQTAKYYSDFFKSREVNSVFAKCHKVQPHPQYPNEFLCSFLFYGMDDVQNIDIGSRILGRGYPKQDYDWPRKNDEKGFHFVMIDSADAITEFKHNFELEILNGHFYSYTSVEDFLFDLDPTEKLDQQKGIKSLPIETGLKLIFEESGDHLLKTEPELTQEQNLFGLKIEELRKLKFIDLIKEEASKTIFKKLLSGDLVASAEEKTFIIVLNKNEYYFRIELQEFKETPSKSKISVLTVRELSDAEKIIYWKGKSKLSPRIDALLIKDLYFESDKQKWIDIDERLKLKGNDSPKIFLMSYKKKSEKAFREWGHLFTNVYFNSKDKLFLIRRLSLYFSNLKIKTHFNFETFTKHQTIQVGNPVHIKALSEAGLVLEYNRAIDLGEFRKFILLASEEKGQPTFLAICNYVEEDKATKGKFLNHFVFYAINDMYLKHLRLWLLANYIHQKEKA